MGIIVQLALLACAFTVALFSVKLHGKVRRLEMNLGKLLVFLDRAHTERRRDLPEERNGWRVFRKTSIDVLMSCRSSIDAIRSVLDELSTHRRDTVEMPRPAAPPMLDPGRKPPPPASVAVEVETARKPDAPSISRRRPVQLPVPSGVSLGLSVELDRSGDRDSSESAATRVIPKPSEAEIEAGALRPPASEAELRAAGLSRPRSQRVLPPVTAPPLGKPRAAPTLPSMQAVDARAPEKD